MKPQNPVRRTIEVGLTGESLPQLFVLFYSTDSKGVRVQHHYEQMPNHVDLYAIAQAWAWNYSLPDGSTVTQANRNG